VTLIPAAALLLDAALGEPRWLWSRLPHPAVLMGRCVNLLDRALNQGTARRMRGVVALALLVAGAALTGWVLHQAGWLLQLLAAAILLAQRSLADHVAAVAHGLRRSPAQGRRAVAMIVSRDTAGMSAPQVARSAIESASENLSDGVVAPLFWLLIFGLPGLLVYKVVNTADSMIGYRTPRHEAFGWASARFDDLLNLVPARATALLIAALTGGLSRWSEIAADARRHRSPNAGWPEAAMARALDVALAGPRSYDGQMRDFPFVNPQGRHGIGPAEIDRAVAILWRVWAALLAIALAVAPLGPLAFTG
jgi:adenosylcobinamide-phosphate synthase